MSWATLIHVRFNNKINQSVCEQTTKEFQILYVWMWEQSQMLACNTLSISLSLKIQDSRQDQSTREIPSRSFSSLMNSVGFKSPEAPPSLSKLTNSHLLAMAKLICYSLRLKRGFLMNCLGQMCEDRSVGVRRLTLKELDTYKEGTAESLHDT